MSRSLGRQAVPVSAALMASNASSYLLTIVAAHLLGRAPFGELSALMAVLVVGMVPALSLQTATALHAARRPDGEDSFGLGLALGGTIGVLALAAAPLVAVGLHLPTGSSLVVALALAVYPVLGACYGMLQGRQRFGVLAFLIGLEAVARTGGAIAGLVVSGTPQAALAGLAVGVAAVAVVAWLCCGRPAAARPSREAVRRMAHAAYATVGLVLLFNLDVILARNVLPSAESGTYSVGFIFAKITYWLPQAVGVVVLPRLAGPGGRRTLVAAIAVVAALDAPIVLASALFGPGLLALVGGAEYRAISDPVWLFALKGCLLAVAQLLLYSRVARADVRSILLVWVAVAVEIGLVVWVLHGSVREVAVAAAATAGLLVLGGSAVELRGARQLPGARDLRSAIGEPATAAGDAEHRGDDGTDGREHGELGGVGVGPVLPVPRQPAADRDHGSDAGAAESDPRERAGA